MHCVLEGCCCVYSSVAKVIHSRLYSQCQLDRHDLKQTSDHYTLTAIGSSVHRTKRTCSHVSASRVHAHVGHTDPRTCKVAQLLIVQVRKTFSKKCRGM